MGGGGGLKLKGTNLFIKVYLITKIDIDNYDSFPFQILKLLWNTSFQIFASLFFYSTVFFLSFFFYYKKKINFQMKENDK